MEQVEKIDIIKKICIKNITIILSLVTIFILFLIKKNIISDANRIIIVISVLVFIILTIKYISNIFEIEKYFQIADFFSMLYVACLCFQLFFSFGYYKATVSGNSMLPTLVNTQNIIVRSTNKNVEFGDVVVLIVDENENNLFSIEDKELIIKRVIGVPGSVVSCINNQVYVNGVAISESYLESSEYTSNFDLYSVIKNNKNLDVEENLVIPDDYYLVLGDNRSYSNDSRYLGLFHKSQILGIAKYKMEDNIFSWAEVK